MIKDKVQINSYQEVYKEELKAINYEWIDTYFEITPLDKKFFDNPTKEIIEKGGYIYLAFFDGEVVGSIGLERINDKEYALTKMGVKPNYQGKKIGSLLMEKALQQASELNLKSLVLYTNQELIGAVNLYIKYGFRFVKLDYTPFKRATVKMQLML